MNGKLVQREKKIELTRILLQLSDGTLRRICSFGNPIDKLDDPYLKLVFPELHGQPLQRTLHNPRWEIGEMEVAPDGMSEFSYHYKGGVAHFKDALSSRIDQDWVVPKIQKSPCLHLLRFLIFSCVVKAVFGFQTLFARLRNARNHLMVGPDVSSSGCQIKEKLTLRWSQTRKKKKCRCTNFNSMIWVTTCTSPTAI